MKLCTRVLGGMLLLALAMGGVARGEELPNWPHEQQAMLNQLDDELLTIQRKLFQARQQQDTAALQTYSAQYASVQSKRRKLIDLTQQQLPSE